MIGVDVAVVAGLLSISVTVTTLLSRMINIILIMEKRHNKDKAALYALTLRVRQLECFLGKDGFIPPDLTGYSDD